MNETMNVSQTLDTNDWITDELPELLLRNILIAFSYSLIVFISLCGNLLVCKTICTKTTRNSTNILIANLAFSDILMTIFNIPFTVVDILLTDWIFGQWMCFLVPFIQACCVYVSAFTMVVIAVNRWQSIYQTKYRQRNQSIDNIWSKLIAVIVIIWILAAIHSIPHTVFNGVVLMETEDNQEIKRCRTIPPNCLPNIQLYITIITFATQYFIPLSISAVVYIRIGFTMASLGNVCSVVNEEQRNELSYKKRRRILLLVLIVTISCLLHFS
ncbi:G-protein coupled receptor 83-like [Oppia nitens]|uniref:G-protein coupled receptor 83-like n=1 Tax=Oppia nitens TaxID=1686743 RepID=UPI0023DB9495|nr:G-protein coupled receptor 83-like [Oppia nitens]